MKWRLSLHQGSPSWLSDAIFYQIFPDRFARNSSLIKPNNLEAWDSPPTTFGFKGGDLLGVVDRLDYLCELGITALYLCPIFQSTANHRYHTHDYFRVDPMLGGDAALRTLIDALHQRGMHVILDGVFNHASRGFFQFNHTLDNRLDSPYLDWFLFDHEKVGQGLAGRSYCDQHAEHAYHVPEGSFERFGYQGWWGMAALPKFNIKNSQVREFLMQVAEHWMRFGIDGWRLDVPNEIDDDSFWREFRQRMKRINPNAYIVGEIWEDAARWLQGDQFDGVMNYPLGRATLGFTMALTLNHDELKHCGYQNTVPLDGIQFATALAELSQRYPPLATGSQMNMLTSHDTPRLLHAGSGDVPGLKLALTVLMTFPGVPCLYYGEEVGMAGGHDPDCRRGFEWDATLWNHEILQHCRSLIQLRKNLPSLRQGTLHVIWSQKDAVSFVRRMGEQQAMIVVNTGRQPLNLTQCLTASGAPGDRWIPQLDTAIDGYLPARSSEVLVLSS